MAESPHYRELLQLLNVSQVEYLIVGGYAKKAKGSQPMTVIELPDHEAAVLKAKAAETGIDLAGVAEAARWR
jgi:hypothetical protein